MKVIELLYSVPREQLLDRWNELYTNKFGPEGGLGYIATVLQMLTDSVPERTDMSVLVETGRAKWIEDGRPDEPWMTDERGARVDVSGLHANLVEDERDYNGEHYPINQRWALSFTAWGQWREMQVIQSEHDEPMSNLDLAAHIIEELTWHGLPEAQEQRRDEVMDRVEEFFRENPELDKRDGT